MIVVDASVIVKWFSPEVGDTAANAFLLAAGRIQLSASSATFFESLLNPGGEYIEKLCQRISKFDDLYRFFWSHMRVFRVRMARSI